MDNFLLSSLLAYALALTPADAAGQEQTRADLPSGNYLYLGSSKADKARSFQISSQGLVLWQNGADKSNAAGQEESSNLTQKQPSFRAAIRKSKKKPELQWDYRKYPIIRWKAHPVSILPGGTVLLSTTYNDKKDLFGRGLMRYSIQLSAWPEGADAVAVQLLDANGFKLTEFNVDRTAFHPMKGSTYLEAADEHPFTKREYWLARDYLVKQVSLP